VIAEAEQLAIERADQTGDGRAQDESGVSHGLGERASDELTILEYKH
jgi:hypothetical protein